MTREIPEIITVGILGVLGGAQIFLRSFLAHYIKKIYKISIGIILLYAGYQTYVQFIDWKGSYLLPPHTPISYFILYTFSRIWISKLIAIISGYVLYRVMEKMNTRKNNQLFFNDELYIAATTVSIMGYPEIVLFIPIFFIVFIMGSIIGTLIYGKNHRTSSYYIWFWAGVCVILCVEYAMQGTSVWNALRI